MNLTKRERTIVLVVAVLVGVLLLDQIALSPLFARLNDAQSRIDAGEQKLQQSTQLFDNSTRARRRWKQIAGETLHSDAPNAEGQVLERVREWAQNAGLTLSSLKPERTQREGEFQKITMRVTAGGSMSQTVHFMQKLQESKIPLRITDVQIAARQEGKDDLLIQMGLATIFEPAAAAQAGRERMR